MNRIMTYCKDEPPPFFDPIDPDNVSEWTSYLNDKVYFEFAGIQEGSWDA